MSPLCKNIAVGLMSLVVPPMRNMADCPKLWDRVIAQLQSNNKGTEGLTCMKTTARLNSVPNDLYDRLASFRSDKNSRSLLRLNIYRNLKCQQCKRSTRLDPPGTNVSYPPNRLSCPIDDDSRVYTIAAQSVVVPFPFSSRCSTSLSTNRRQRMVKWTWIVGCWHEETWDSLVNILPSSTVVLVRWRDFGWKSNRTEIDLFAIGWDLWDRDAWTVHRRRW